MKSFAALLVLASAPAWAEMSQTVYIKGMHCEDCISRVRAKVCAIEGIKDCQVKVDSAVLKVDKKIETSKIAKALEGTEFTVSEEAPKAPTKMHKHDPKHHAKESSETEG